jgi:hypothetical protein
VKGVLGRAIRDLDTPGIDSFVVGHARTAAENRFEFTLGWTWFDEFCG